MREITKDVYMLEGIGPAPAFLLADPDGFTLIDSGGPKKSKAVIAEIEATQHAVTDLKQIILTHCHSDHTGNVAELVARSQAKVLAHQDDVPYILGQQSLPTPTLLQKLMFGLMDRIFPLHIEQVDRSVVDGDTIDALGGLKVIHAPGHTPGSIALYQPERKIMFFGDLLFNERKLKIAPKLFNVDTPRVADAVRQVITNDIDIAFFGHGEPYTEHAGEKIRQVLQ